MKRGQLRQMVDRFAHNVGVSASDGGGHVDVLDAFLTLQWDILNVRGLPMRRLQERAVASLVSNAVFGYNVAAQNALARQSFALPLLRRGVLECCLYAARIADSEEASEAWWLRHKEYLEHHHEAVTNGKEPDVRRIQTSDRANRRAARRLFESDLCTASLSNVLRPDPDADQVAQAFADQYALEIDQGAHPNVMLVLLNSETRSGSEPGTLNVTTDWMTNSDPKRFRQDMRSLFTLGLLVVRVLCALQSDAAAKVRARARLAEIGEAVQRLPR